MLPRLSLTAFALAAVSCLLISLAAATADAAEGVVVRGRPTPMEVRTRVDAYIRNVSAGPRDEAIARWRDPICPLVSGLAREQAEYMLARLSQIAVQVGAPLGP